MKSSEIYKSIGKVIRLRRKQFELTQAELALQVGISRASLANIESGRQNLLVHHLYNFASALKMEPSDLLPTTINRGQEKIGSTNIPVQRRDLNEKQLEEVISLMTSVQIDASTNNSKD